MNGLQYAIDLADKTFGATIRKAKQQTEGLDNAVKKTNDNLAHVHVTGKSSFGGLSKYAKRAALSVASIFAVGQIYAFGNEITRAGAQIEGYENAIKFASGKEGAQNIKFLNDQIEILNLDKNSSYKGFKTLTGSLKGTELQGQATRDIFEAISIASTTMGLSAEQSEGAFLALSQMASKGKVQAEELRGQLGERLPGALGIAARAMGVNQKQLNKMLESGQVYANDFLPKFAKELKKTFEGGLPAAAKSMQASINRKNNAILSFKNSTAQMLRPLIMGIQDTVPKALKFIQKLIAKTISLKSEFLDIWNATLPLRQAILGLNESMGGTQVIMSRIRILLSTVTFVVGIFSEGLGFLIDNFKIVAPLIGGTTIALKAYGLYTKIAGRWTTVLRLAQMKLNLAFAANPIGLTIIALTALIGAAIYAYKKIGWFRGGVLAAWEVLKGFGRDIKIHVVDRFYEMLKGITTIGQALSLFFDGEWKKAWETGKKATENLFGKETKEKAEKNAKATAKAAQSAYIKGQVEAIQNNATNSKSTKHNAFLSNVFGDNKGLPKNYKIPTVDGAGSKVPTTGGANKNQTITINKFVENLIIHMEKGKTSTDDIKKQIQDAFLEITSDLEKRLINA